MIWVATHRCSLLNSHKATEDEAGMHIPCFLRLMILKRKEILRYGRSGEQALGWQTNLFSLSYTASAETIHIASHLYFIHTSYLLIQWLQIQYIPHLQYPISNINIPWVSYLHTTLHLHIRNHLIFVNKFNSDLHSYKHKENGISI